MLFPSFATALTFVTLASASSNRVKRQNSAASAALALNTALATQICVIAQGIFSASAALGGNSTLSGCASLLAKPTTVGATGPTGSATAVIHVTGCVNSTQPSFECSSGTLTATGGFAVDTPHFGPSPFTIFSSNGQCTGIRTPFTLNVAAGNSVTPFASIQWNIDCTTGYMSLADTTTHLCYGSDGILYPAASGNSCVIGQSFTAIFQ